VLHSHRRWEVGAHSQCVLLLSFLRHAVIGSMDVELPAMGVTQIGDSNESKLHCTFVVHDIAVIFRILLHHDIGFGSAYCDGLWSTDNLTT
jgi:cyclopropane-fatty-acyl-phospholipid synthase